MGFVDNNRNTEYCTATHPVRVVLLLIPKINPKTINLQSTFKDFYTGYGFLFAEFTLTTVKINTEISGVSPSKKAGVQTKDRLMDNSKPPPG